MSQRFACSNAKVPLVQLGLAKKGCLRANGDKLTDSKTIAAFISKHYGCSPQERFITLLFDSRMQVVAVHEVALGGLASVGVDPRVVFAGAVTSGASAMIIAHNHPSADPAPSSEDLALTQRLVAGAKLLGLRVLDHIVVGRGGAYVSMKEQGQMPE